MKNAGRTVGKRVIALLSVLFILCSLIVIPASAADTPTVSGVWVFNDSLSFVGLSSDILQYVNYTLPNRSNTSTICHAFKVEDTGSLSVGIKTNLLSLTVIYRDNVWVADSYKVVDFGSTSQEVSEEFYEWFTANAIQQAAECPLTYSVKIYDDVGILDDVDVPEGSYLYIGSFGYDIIGPDHVVIGGSALDPSLNGSMFCGLTADPSAEVATYGPGTTLNITQDLEYYVVLKDTYEVDLYSQYGNYIDTIDCAVGQTAITINLGSLYFDLWNAPAFTYNFNLGAGQMILGLSSSPSSQYAYQWGVGETVYVNGPTTLYVIKSYPYPVVLNFNNGVDITTFTGFQKSTVSVNESSIDFIDNEGNVQSYVIPLNGSDDAFWGLATSPNQSTPEYVPGDVIYAYDTTDLYLVRKSDYYSAISGGGIGDSGGTGDSGSTPDQVVGDVPDVGDFVSDQAISSMSDIFASVFNSPLILSIFMISVVLMFVSYVLFGKKT